MRDPNVIDRRLAARLAQAPRDEEVLVGCLRVEAGRAVVRSRVRFCDRCGSPVWVSVRLLQAAPPGVVFVCLDRECSA